MARDAHIHHLRCRVRLLESVLRQLESRYTLMLKTPQEWDERFIETTRIDIAHARAAAMQFRAALDQHVAQIPMEACAA